METKSSNFKTFVLLGVALVVTIALVLGGLKLWHNSKLASQPDISGAWEGTVSVQKMKLRVVLKLARTNNVYGGTVDSIDQGARDVPVSDLTYDYPTVKFGLSGGVYTSKLNSGATEMSGAWKQAGMTTTVVLKRTTEPDTITAALVESDYAPRAGSDLQGLWKGTLVAGQMSLRLNFKIAEQADGTFRAEMDSVDQGANGLAASAASYDRPTVKLEFSGINGTYEGAVAAGDKKIEGKWKQGGKTFPLTLERGEPDVAAAAPTDASYAYKSKSDLQGHWKGALSLPKAKLRLALNIAKLADGTFSASMVSIDQGSGEIPASEITFNAPNLQVDWKGIGGSFTGELKSGKLSGTWQQGGGKMPLVLTRE